MKVTLHPDAERDLMDAASFYEREGSPAVAARFVAEFKRISGLIGEHPQIGSTRGSGLRGITMAVFPFTVIYRVEASQLKILIIKHDIRRPRFGNERS